MGTPGVPESVQGWPGEPPGVGEVPLPTGQNRGRRPLGRAPGKARGEGTDTGSRADHPNPPLSASPPTAVPHHLRRHLFHRFLRLPHRRVSFSLESSSCSSLLLLSTFPWSLVARLLAHFLTYYGRGIQPSSENTTKPALFMTIQRGRRQYGAASQPAPRPLRPRPWRPGPALDPAPSSFGSREASVAPPTGGRELWLQTPVERERFVPSFVRGTVNPSKPLGM